MHSLEHHRVLAFGVRPRRLAYCVLEGTTRVLDWGVKAFGTGAHAVKIPLSVKTARLISAWQPHAVVMKATKGRRSAQKMRVIERQATLAGATVHFITIEAIRHAFPTERNKYERGRLIAASLPELALALPPKPKLWQPEPHRIGYFDAASIAFAYFKQLEQSKE